MAFRLRLNTAGKAALANAANRGTNAVRFTKLAIGSGQGRGGADDDGRAALRHQRAAVAVGGTTEVAGQIALLGNFAPAASYDVTEVGLLGQVGSGAETLLAYWSNAGQVLARAVSGTRLAIAGALTVAAAAADVTVTVDAKVTLLSQGLRPLWDTPPPHVATADHLLPVTVAAAAAGGTVTVAAGTKLSLGEEIAAGKSAVSRVFTTAEWTSADLTAEATYYLRAKIANEAVAFYVQQGADADAAPSGLVGTANGSSGGGFPSTPLDARLAKIVTGAAGTKPKLTRYPVRAGLPAEARVQAVRNSVTALQTEVRRGLPTWAANVDYPHPSAVFGSDGQAYLTKAASGPGHGGAQNPTADSDKSHWQPLSLAALGGATGAGKRYLLQANAGGDLSLVEAPFWWAKTGNIVVRFERFLNAYRILDSLPAGAYMIYLRGVATRGVPTEGRTSVRLALDRVSRADLLRGPFRFGRGLPHVLTGEGPMARVTASEFAAASPLYIRCQADWQRAEHSPAQYPLTVRYDVRIAAQPTVGT